MIIYISFRFIIIRQLKDMVVHYQCREHDGYHGQQLDQDVDGRA